MSRLHARSIRDLLDRYPGEKTIKGFPLALETTDDEVECGFVVMPDTTIYSHAETDEIESDDARLSVKPLGLSNARRNRADLIREQLSGSPREDKYAQRSAMGMKLWAEWQQTCRQADAERRSGKTVDDRYYGE
jgi:hypothetical protein